MTIKVDFVEDGVHYTGSYSTGRISMRYEDPDEPAVLEEAFADGAEVELDSRIAEKIEEKARSMIADERDKYEALREDYFDGIREDTRLGL